MSDSDRGARLYSMTTQPPADVLTALGPCPARWRWLARRRWRAELDAAFASNPRAVERMLRAIFADDSFSFALDEPPARPYCRTMQTEQQKRDEAGRYTAHTRCDGCGGRITGDHETDEDVCGNSDGPGFYLCDRKRCETRRNGLDVAARRSLYTAQRQINKAA